MIHTNVLIRTADNCCGPCTDCVPVPEPCEGVGYDMAYQTNNGGVLTSVLVNWQSLDKVNCHPNVRLLACALFAPKCPQNNTEFLQPCKKLCEGKNESCAVIVCQLL